MESGPPVYTDSQGAGNLETEYKSILACAYIRVTLTVLDSVPQQSSQAQTSSPPAWGIRSQTLWFSRRSMARDAPSQTYVVPL
jgi:hypothetical protein